MDRAHEGIGDGAGESGQEAAGELFRRQSVFAAARKVRRSRRLKGLRLVGRVKKG
jgi:hypothetical protein